MLDDDSILDSPVLYSEEEILAEFQESCEAEAYSPGQHTERVREATKDLVQRQERKNRCFDQ